MTKRWSRLALGGAALTGAAWWSERSRQRIEPLTNPVGGREVGFAWRGYRIAGTVRGEGPPVLLAHSIHAAAWSWEWRHTVEALARSHRVVTFDLLGFGLSERPDIDYTAELYIELLLDVAQHVVGEPCALVANSLSGAHALTAAARAPEQFPALVVIQPTGMTRLTERNQAAEAVQQLIRLPLAGAGMFNALTSRPSIRYYLRQSYFDEGRVTPGVVEDHYRTASQPGARYATAAFVGFRLNCDVRAVVSQIRQPTLLVWGSHPHSNPLSERDAFVRARPDWETLLVNDAGDLPHDEQPRRFNAVVSQFLERAWPQRAPTQPPRTSAVSAARSA
jgi:pimeloyl-ACP methyl ester carboxylesterase